MRDFIVQNRAVIEQRVRESLLGRSAPKSTTLELEVGIPRFLDQLLEIFDGAPAHEDLLDEIEDAATDYGARLFELGFTASQVVRGYGSICGVVLTLAQERRVVFPMRDFELLHRIVDLAIAGAITAHERQQELDLRGKEVERLGCLAHELRNAIAAARMSFEALKSGAVGAYGRTAEVLERSLRRMGNLVDHTLTDVRLQTEAAPVFERVKVAEILDHVGASMERDAETRGETLEIAMDEAIEIETDRQLLTSAVSNLVQNGIKYTQRGGRIFVHGYRDDDRLLIDVEDQCGGLPAGTAQELFRPFFRRTTTTAGVGLGLSIVSRAVKTLGGEVRIRDLPGKGCVFTIELPSRRAA